MVLLNCLNVGNFIFVNKLIFLKAMCVLIPDVLQHAIYCMCMYLVILNLHGIP